MQLTEGERGILITRLPLEDMALLALGLPLNDGVKRVLDGLLEGKRVAVRTDAFEYRRFCRTAPRGVYQKFVAMERSLREMGVVRAGREEEQK